MRGTRGRSENFQPAGFEAIDDAGHQRCLGSDDGQADVVAGGKLEQRVDILGRDSDIFDAVLEPGSGIAGRDVDSFDELRLRAFPGQRMFTTAAAHD